MLRKATKQDVNDILLIIDEAIAYLKSQNIDQWQNNYPNRQSIIHDINNGVSFVYELHNQVIGTMALILDKDVDYDIIEDGQWLNDEAYLTIHRIAIKNKFKNSGVALNMMDQAFHYALQHHRYNVRIDTHPDNKAMCRFLEKQQFEYCGVVYINKIAKRLAYQKILKQQ